MSIQHSGAKVGALLDRLDKVKRIGPGRWKACCPGHDDKSPSLSIRETEDGTVLLKCWSGCGAANIVTAVGLELKDLFPDRPGGYGHGSLAPRERWIPRDVLASLAREALIAALAAEQAARGVVLSEEDVQRVMTAAGRIRAAAREVGV